MDYGAIQDLLATHPIEVLVDVLAELVVRFAVLDRSADPRQEFRTLRSAEMTRRDLVASVLALAGEAPCLSDDQLRRLS